MRRPALTHLARPRPISPEPRSDPPRPPARYGVEQFTKWRRSYDTKPPAVSSFSQHYPGNDQRYVQNIRDVRAPRRPAAPALPDASSRCSHN